MNKNSVSIPFLEGFSVVTVCIITKMFCGFLPHAIYNYGPSAWYISLISAVFTLLVFLFCTKNKEGVINNINTSFGKTFGMFITLGIYVYFILYFSMNLREIVRVIKIYNFPSTPSLVFSAAFLVCAAVLCFAGDFSVTKLSGFYIKIIIGTFIVIFLLGIGQYNFENLAPIGGYGIGSIFEGSVFQLTLFTDIFLLMVLAPKIANVKKLRKTGVSVIVVSAVLVALSFIFYICVFDYTVVGNKTSGLIEVVKNVYYGHLFQRMESVFFLMMVVSAGISVCIWLFGAVEVYSGAFGIEDKKELIIPTALVVLCLSSMKLDTVFHLTGRYGGIFLFSVIVITEIAGRVKRRVK